MTHRLNYHKNLLLLLAVLTATRIIGLIYSPLNLHGDEAQYWAWAQNLDWGYFSKPPMIAWLIAATTSIFGDAEWAVRLSTPLLHPITAYVIFHTGRFIWDARTGFWAALLYIVMPAVSLSSGIVSTDVMLLLCWALGLNAWLHLRATPRLSWALLLGASIGFGMLSKYAMLFFLPPLIISVFVDPQSRKGLLSIYGVCTAIVSSLIIAPNIAWNAAHDFATVSHTAANANLKGIPFHPLELLEFWGTQIGVFGPLTLALLIMALAGFALKKDFPLKKQPELLLALFVFTPLMIISIEALLSRANANWAVTAYIGGALLSARYGLTYWPRLLKAGLFINITLGVIVTIAGLAPSFADRAGQANAFKRMRGWTATTSSIADILGDEQRYSALAVDNRLVFYGLHYYGAKAMSTTSKFSMPASPEFHNIPLRIWLHTAHIDNHAEATAALAKTSANNRPVLIINYYADYEDELTEDFARLNRLPDIKIDLGGGITRTLRVWEGNGYTPTAKTDR